MGKVVKVLAGVAIIGAVIATGGLAGAGLWAGGLLGGGLLTAGTIIAFGASIALSALAPKPKIPETQLGRLNVQLQASAPRKAVFGTTAFPLDLRYHEGTGTDQEFIHYVIAHAAHEVASIDEIWFEQDLAWSAGGGVTGKYSGYLTVTTRTEGAAGNEVSISGNWGTGERLTGCAYTYIRIKRTGNSKKTESPLVSGLPSRVTVIGEGALLYDPRRDSTVTGGSGSERADDQTTWGAPPYSPADSYDNPALQVLWWLLGWKINGKLSIGCGVPPARIDLESFIEAANICDEAISLSGGGTQPRYRSSGTASDADDRMAVINTLLTACNGTLRDTGGKLALTVIKNDLADYVLDLEDGDLLGDFSWQQTRGLSESYNVVRGRFVDPSSNSLYQLVDYPEVSIASPDGIERVLSLDLAYVEEGRRAQRIAKQVLQRNQYRGTFEGVFSAKALGCEVGEVVRLSLETLGWSNKLFRVISKQVRMDGQVPLTLLEESADIYAWDTEESAVVTPTAPTVYDPLNSPFILGDTEAGTTADWPNVTDSLSTKPNDNATVGAKAGVNLLDGSDVTLGDADIKNSVVTIGADGLLAGAGGGQVTIGGLGYIGDLNATLGATWGVNITGEPVALADINPTEGSKLTGIETGATVGATSEQVTNIAIAQATADGKNNIYRVEAEPQPALLRVGDPDLDSPSLSLSFTASFNDGDIWLRPDTKQATAWDGDLAEWTADALIDLTKSINGNAALQLDYESDGTTLLTNTPLIEVYGVAAAGGDNLTTGVTWTANTVLATGQVVGDVWTGSAPSITGTGTGVLSINSGLEVASAKINLTATVGGLSYGPFQVAVSKNVAEPSPESGADFDSVTLNGTTVSGSTYTTIATLTVTTKSGSTDVDLNTGALTFVCTNNELYSLSNMKVKWQYESAPSTWTDVGSEADSDPDAKTIDEGGFFQSTFASITCNRNQGSLSASTEYNFRLQARISSGETGKPFNFFGGTVSAQG